MVIGEAKSAGGIVDEDDIANMRFILDKLDCHNVSGYLAFSKTEDAFTEQELTLFRQLREEDIPTILLTNKELEPYEPYLEDEGEDLPHRHAVTISDMAQNSIARYLR